jgi:hypothetical protein
MKKLFAVGVIVLFLGLACAPSINADVRKESELVEITTEICGLGGGKHTVQLTKEEAGEVEQLIDDIERRLDGVETREETVEIFNDAVVELDKYGLLGGLFVKEAQKLVNGESQKKGMMKSVKGCSIIPLETYDNSNCSIYGKTNKSLTFFRSSTLFLDLFLSYVDKLPDLLQYIIVGSLFLILLATCIIWIPMILIRPFIPFYFNFNIDLGLIHYDYYTQCTYYYPCEGSIKTTGDKGTLMWDGKFYGNLDINKSSSIAGIRYDLRGIHDFNGIKLTIGDDIFFGHAEYVSLTRDPPVKP